MYNNKIKINRLQCTGTLERRLRRAFPLLVSYTLPVHCILFNFITFIDMQSIIPLLGRVTKI
jgi:hypothetical protein